MPGLIGIILTLIAAALVYWVGEALGLPGPLPLIAAILVFIAGLFSDGYGFGGRFGDRDGW